MGAASNCICTSLCCFLVMIVVSSSPAAAASPEEFKVGDAQGWRQPPLNHTHMYTLWASRRTFHVGDSLRFEYKNDSVLVVDKWGYYHCNSSTPISVFNDGNSMVDLDIPGPMYFISGDPEHCHNGQKLLIDVIPPPLPISPSPLHSQMSSPAPSPGRLSSSGERLPTSSSMVSVLLVLAAFFATAFMA